VVVHKHHHHHYRPYRHYRPYTGIGFGFSFFDSNAAFSVAVRGR
jgi:hypothetical protein